MEYYSQFGTDKFLNEKYFNNRPTGTYVDIGAHDGITGSNSLFFEKLGWQGICFEPMPQAFEKLLQNRVCRKSTKAIADFEGEAEFLNIVGYSEQLSGLLKNYNVKHLERVNREIDEHNQEHNTIKVRCGLFNKEVPYTDIDVLTIDTEGSEASIIKTIDFDIFDIKFIVVEFNYEDYHLVNYLEEKKFFAEIRLGIDIIFKKYDA